MKIRFFLLLIIVGLPFFYTEAKKIKQTFKIEKESKIDKGKNEIISGYEISVKDSLDLKKFPEFSSLIKVTFAGYDKEANSSRESFIIVNPTDKVITGYEVKIEYFDLKGRMLNSRIVKETCLVPPGESRHLNIKSWDTQHTYYYYLGNEPKKVATPFKVSFIPLTFWIE